MGLKLYNTLTQQIEPFHPLQVGKVRLYACGPTVYDFAHVGNFRAFIFVDLLKRFLRFSGYHVYHITNITDVDDRIIERCLKEKRSILELTPQYKNAFFEDLNTLGIEPADRYPAATDHIKDMIKIIQLLIENRHAYVTKDGSVFFNISTFPEYGKLSGIKIDQLTKTERILADNYEKVNARDFALWKAWKPEDGEVGWNSPWGKGRPGWHIECSAMSMKYLNKHFDIHCGGVDLIFPHHENEIAQSVGATGQPFVNIWLHCEHLLVNNRKMSKSLGNYYTLRDLLNKDIPPSSIRFFLLTTHYRHKINLTFEHLHAATSSVERLRDFRRRLELLGSEYKGDLYQSVENEFKEVLNDDLNISEGIATIFEWIRSVHRQIDTNQLSSREAGEALYILKRFDSILNIIFNEEIALSEKDKKLIKEREDARKNHNWGKADEIRNYFLKKNIYLEDTEKGTVVKRLIPKIKT